ncbi:MAG TPA: histidinol-phosphate transaminase [Gaiellaceae bacterium]|nr:histidinol-phosphate transaminase [Gaiellaceae bacterium]
MTDWSRIVRPSLIGLEPYRPGPSLEELQEAHGLDEIVKLNWNEGLEGPFPGVREEVLAELERAWIYPAEAYTDLRESVAAWVGATPDQIVPAHGIQALVAMVVHAFVEPGDAVVLTTPTYGLYATTSAAAGARLVRVPSRDLRHDVVALAAAAREADARLVWLCDPNNPTGSHVTHDEWETLLAGLPERCAVVVDEAYVEYVDPALRLERLRDVEAGRPVILMRTFSKIFALAGLRLGYAVVDRPLVDMLDVVLEPFNVNRAALAAGRASLRRLELVEERRRANEEGRERLAEILRETGAKPYPSQANFLLVDVGVDDVALTDGLVRRGFLVRAGSEFGLGGCVRITTGPAPLMERAAREVADVRGELLEPSAALEA